MGHSHRMFWYRRYQSDGSSLSRRATGDSASNATGDSASNATGDSASNATGDSASNATGDSASNAIGRPLAGWCGFRCEARQRNLMILDPSPCQSIVIDISLN